MAKRKFTLILMVAVLVMLLGGQAVMAAPLGEAEIVANDWGAHHHSIRFRLVDEDKAVAIAKGLVRGRQVEVETARLVVFRSRVAWEVVLKEWGRYGATTHQVMVDLFSGRVLQHKVKETPAPKPVEVDRDKAIEIAKNEAARAVQIRATAHMKNSGLWTVNMSQRGADPTERIYVTIREDGGEVIERGRIKDGQVQVAKITPEQAIEIARGRVNYRTETAGIGLVLDRDSLLWEVRLSRVGRGTPTVQRFLIGAFTGRVVAQG